MPDPQNEPPESEQPPRSDEAGGEGALAREGVPSLEPVPGRTDEASGSDTVPPSGFHDHRLNRADPTPRGLILGWCVWLLGSWMVTLAADSAVPAVRWMVFAALTGLMVLWPALRLSQSSRPGVESNRDGRDERGLVRRRSPRGEALARMRGVLLDWLCLVLVFQAVVWPLRISAGWSIEQTLWLNVSIAGWGLLVGVVIAWGVQASRGLGVPGQRGGSASDARQRPGRTELRRGTAMLVCVLLFVGEPAAMAMVNELTAGRVTWLSRVSPVQVVWHMTESPVHWRAWPWAGVSASVVLAAVLGWVILGARAISRGADERG